MTTKPIAQYAVYRYKKTLTKDCRFDVYARTTPDAPHGSQIYGFNREKLGAVLALLTPDDPGKGSHVGQDALYLLTPEEWEAIQGGENEKV